eukprot:TRINITY_DN6483_c0_g1_i1.p1 TRINITY_DN6483_c0_g1~~TRINITY_DN6483_c0_g1_i1.p1  ORF type:complete len:836 (+),score=234.84 TRINITY_DN6483_c0_g1_i1:156-2663(+)
MSIRKVLVLGSNFQVAPLVHYLSAHSFAVTVAARHKHQIEAIIRQLKNASAVLFDIEHDSLDKLDALVKLNDIVISFLPSKFHPKVIQVAIANKKHIGITGPATDELKLIAQKAKAAGVLFLAELGLEPGLSWMGAKKMIDQIHERNGKILGFTSMCGALPAPLNNNNPFGYKIFEHARHILTRHVHDAVFLRNGETTRVPLKEIFARRFCPLDELPDLGKFECLLDSDSLMDLSLFDIPECQSVMRGTYRYRGWRVIMQVLLNAGYFSLEPISSSSSLSEPLTYASLCARLLKLSSSSSITDSSLLAKAFADKMRVPLNGSTMEAFLWLGLFSNKAIPVSVTTPFAALCALFDDQCVYAPKEIDMVLVKHTFEVQFSLAKRQTIVSSLIDFGSPSGGVSSMSKAASLPLAIVVRAFAEGRLDLAPGLHRPFTPAIYNLVLGEMAEMGIQYHDQVLMPELWLRAEVRTEEERAILSPSACLKLKRAGFRVTVEKSSRRCYGDDAYAMAGCRLVESHSWISEAPNTAFILGIKELLKDDKSALQHRHIYFAHCYKNQSGWKDTLARFVRGSGLLYDPEFLTDNFSRRIASFGVPAGRVGMCLGALQWAYQILGGTMPPLSSWRNTQAMISECSNKLQQAIDQNEGRLPSVLVVGALGQCGYGAVSSARALGLRPIKWDQEETRTGGPYPELVHVDILVNCVLLSEQRIAPLLTESMIDAHQATRKLRVFVDVSADYLNPLNPFPIYSEGTTLSRPCFRSRRSPLPLDIIALDQLGSLIPMEATNSFSEDLLPSLLQLHRVHKTPDWVRTEELFNKKVEEAKLTKDSVSRTVIRSRL